MHPRKLLQSFLPFLISLCREPSVMPYALAYYTLRHMTVPSSNIFVFPKALPATISSLLRTTAIKWLCFAFPSHSTSQMLPSVLVRQTSYVSSLGADRVTGGMSICLFHTSKGFQPNQNLKIGKASKPHIQPLHNNLLSVMLSNKSRQVCQEEGIAD